MRTFIIVSLVLGLVTSASAQGQQPCYNAASPNTGIGNHCQCEDGTCWQLDPQADIVCNPTSSGQLIPCPAAE
ncbi:hypothetical protein HRS9139_02113 [Pyrenophora teres f. teres]|uniref:Uncharacterized protein n=1 Tax=Pyrenophora teres f. teres TaxID=97479 RepID=A0A6S6VH57_9PLEO|nr:hypothetical protein HRS9139_02113 [Pyrenophora teres f. teres]KAE8870514.1 hypothetical protein PTNB29_00858 [Pyrenophora teres f. teres]CAA9960692.1 hypothetical protein PTMSG1_04076 [Pyrenophora teres f. maculata]CAE7012577.1 hypothetical protein PTTW11_02377 [Pyrenophora teres f. teres]